MDFSRLKKTFAGVAVAAITLTQSAAVFAHNYSDIPAGIWYEDAVDALVDLGYLDNQGSFRGGQNATRAEFVKLAVLLNGGVLSTAPAVPSFDDVPADAWFYSYFEEAGKEGWVRGDGDCYGTHPCYARPGANINRAEAAALIVRSFALEPTGDAAQFVDNLSGQWYTDVIQTAADHCVLQGDDSTGRVRPSDNMNRAEMVVMLDRVSQGLVYGVDCGGDSDDPAEAMILNVSSISPDTVEVEFNVTLDATSAEDVSHYTVMNGAEVAVTAATLLNPQTVELTVGDTLVAGHEYTVTVEGLLAADGSTLDDAMTFVGYTAFEQGDGVLELSLASSNPVGDTVPMGAVGVVLLSVDFTAACDDTVMVENLTILHEGFGDEADLSGIYAAINGARVTRKRTIDSEDQTADLRFASPLVLDPCETVTVDIVGDLTSTAVASSEHNLVVELPSDVFSNAQEVTGNFPLRGNTFRVAAVTSGTVSIAYRSVSPDEVEVGDKGVVIGKWEVSINSTEDQTFYSMTIEQNSSASDGDFTNVAIRRTDGTILTNTVSQSVGDFLTLVFDPPFTVLEGDKITMEVIADITGGAADSVILHFEETSDIFAVGSLYGYGVNGQLYGSQVQLPSETADLPDTVTIDAGEFTIGIDGPASEDYTRDDNDAVLALVEFQTGGEDIDIKDLYIAIEGQTSTGGMLCANGGSATTSAGCATGDDDTIAEILEDVEIRNVTTGRTIDGVRLTANSADSGHFASGTDYGTYQIYRFDDFIIRGDEEWEFRVDFIDNGAGKHPQDGDEFRIHICGEPTHILSNGSLIANTAAGSLCDFGAMGADIFSGLTPAGESSSYQMEVEGLSTGDKVGDVRPRGNIAGNFHRIAAASLTVTQRQNGTTDTSVENAKNVSLLRFDARAGEAEDILFTKAVFASQSGSLNNANNYALWADSTGDGSVDMVLESGVAAQNSLVTFNDLAGGGFVIKAEDTVSFEVRADIASNLTDSDLQLQFGSGSSNTNEFIEAEELDDGSSLSGISYRGVAINSASSTDITVTNEADAQNWVLVTQGDLFVTESTSQSIKSRQLLGGALSETVLRLQFRAENEAIDVTDLQISSSGGVANSVKRLELYKEGETEYFATADVAGCGSDDVLTTNPNDGANTIRTFCASMENGQLIVPENDEVDVLVKPLMKTDVEGASSNDAVELWITSQAVFNEAAGSGAVRAEGAESSNPLTANTDGDAVAEGEIFIGTDSPGTNADINGTRHVSVLSKIASITDASPDDNGDAIPLGQSDLGSLRFTAADHNNGKDGDNDVNLSGVTFNVNATNVAITSNTFALYNADDPATTATCTGYDATDNGTITAIASGSLLVECSLQTDGTNWSSLNTTISPGDDIVLTLQATVTDANTSTAGAPSAIQVSIQDFDNISTTGFGGDVSGASHIEWVDDDGNNANDVTFNWVEYPTTVVKSTSYAG